MTGYRSSRRWAAREQRELSDAKNRRCPKCRARSGEDCWSNYASGQRVPWVHDERRRQA